MNAVTKKFIFLFYIIPFVVALLVSMGLVFLFAKSSHHTTTTTQSYQPQFKESPFELVMGDGSKHPSLYYLTKTSYTVGDKVDSLKLIRVHKKTNTPMSEYLIDYLDNHIDAVGNGYVMFDLTPGNFDCFAVYEDNHLVKYQHIDFSRLPSPSDAWLCAGYNFKQAPK